MQNLNKNKSIIIESPSTNWTYKNFSYTYLDDETIVIIGCCVNDNDLWYLRVNDTGLVENMSLNLNMSSTFYYFSLLQQMNSALLVFEKYDEEKNLRIQMANIMKFLNNSAVGILPSDYNNANPNSGGKNNDENDETKSKVVTGVVVSLMGIIVLVLIFCLVKKCKQARYLKYSQAENKELRPAGKSDENNFE